MVKSLNLFVPSKAPSHRQERVAQEIRFYVSSTLMRGDIPPLYTEDGELMALPTTVTITDIKVSPDLKHATLYVMPLGGEHQEDTIAFLKASTGYFRKELSQKLQLRVVPKLSFQIDLAFEATKKIEDLFRKIEK
ncbi:MAG: 30S ribosome-binding factor RbfA [Alphaproteobacteria bacterium]|nr:30S ribosome-binding factor RbfA [Alphaproteobacteria bacterium]